ncbi:retrotransposon protein, putative, ty1-copia subclass [Tanacetum coccineum]
MVSHHQLRRRMSCQGWCRTICYGCIWNSTGTSYANLFTGESTRKSVNFSTSITLAKNGIDVAVPVKSIRIISKRFVNTAYGFFLRKRVDYPVIANYVRNTWGKYGLVKSMLNSSTGLFLFHLSSMDGFDSMLENGPWFIRNNLLILKKWNPDVHLLKEDDVNVLIWVKLLGVPVTAFSEDGLSDIATKLGTPYMLDSYTYDMCMQSWGRLSYARVMIELRADVELKDTIVVAMPKIVGEGFYTCTIRVEYECKHPMCACCKVFVHIQDECPKNLGSDVTRKSKIPSQAPRGVPVGHNVRFKPVKQLYRPVSKKNNVNTSGNKKKDVSQLKRLKNLIIDGIIKLVDDEGKPLKKIDYPDDHDSEAEVASVDNEMANFLASERVVYEPMILIVC